ncbi:hypothetical protein LSAT2_028725 [Lamellibrachia satsuma]|nr:hypothetical protein LSAT2_028725 [Lamellibrachia satsuma]
MLLTGQTQKSRKMSPESAMKPAPSVKLSPSTTPSPPSGFETLTVCKNRPTTRGQRRIYRTGQNLSSKKRSCLFCLPARILPSDSRRYRKPVTRKVGQFAGEHRITT